MPILSPQALHALFDDLQAEAAGLKAITETSQRNQAIMDLREKLLTARQAASDSHASVLEKVEILEQEIASFKEWEREKQRYQAQLFDPGVTVYAEKEAVGHGEATSHFCPNCYADRKIRPLQGTDRETYGRKIRFCMTCKTELAYGYKTQRDFRVRRTISDYDPLDN